MKKIDIYKITAIYEFDPFEFDTDLVFHYRVEILNKVNTNNYKVKVLSFDMYNIEPTFLGDVPKDKYIAMLFTYDLTKDWDSISGSSEEEVLTKVINILNHNNEGLVRYSIDNR